jgi:hypothetical protein
MSETLTNPLFSRVYYSTISHYFSIDYDYIFRVALPLLSIRAQPRGSVNQRKALKHLQTNSTNNHMRHRSKIILAAFSVALFACAAFAPQSQAVPVTGSITFAGTVELNTASAGTATTVTAWHGLGAGGNPQVQSSSGSFALFAPAGAAGVFSAPWSFNSGPIMAFWTAGGFTFSLTVSTIMAQ